MVRLTRIWTFVKKVSAAYSADCDLSSKGMQSNQRVLTLYGTLSYKVVSPSWSRKRKHAFY